PAFPPRSPPCRAARRADRRSTAAPPRYSRQRCALESRPLASPDPACEAHVVRRSSSFRHPQFAEGIDEVFALGEIIRVAARSAGPEVADGKPRIELEPGRDSRFGFFQLAEFDRRRGEIEMRQREISIGFDGAAE